MNLSNLILAVCAPLTALVFSISSPACEPVEPTVMLEHGDSVFPITVEEYVAGVIACEMPHTFHEEALKAQAVAARTYLYYCLENNARIHESGDVCSDFGHCCGFTTEKQLSERFGDAYAKQAFSAANAAAQSTCGEVLFYDAKPILSVWHSSSYKRTEDSGNVWLASLPYLASVSTPEKAESYTVSFTLAEVKSRLRAAAYKYNSDTTLLQYNTPTGRCDTLIFGNAELSGTAVRNVFGLKSTAFTAWYYNGRLCFTVHGYGHGVGMSQYGANALAADGSDYREILAHYYTGSTIGVLR